MTDDLAQMLLYALLLILPLTALVARRLPLRATVKMVLVWCLIFAVLFLAVSLWERQ